MFKKIFAVVAACATVATMSISAFAAGETASHEAGSVSVNGYAAVSGATQYTVMVFEDSFETDYDVAKIFYINQGADYAALLSGMLVKGGELADGDYTVRIGNDMGSVVDVDLKIEGETVTIVYGDADGSGTVNRADLLHLAKYFGRVPGITIDTDASDADGNGTVNRADLLHLAKYFGRVPGIVLGPQSN